MTFEEPDAEVFRGLKLALIAADKGGTMPTVFNAANEKAVELFLARKIGFLEIYDIIEGCMQDHRTVDLPDVDTILNAEREAYEYIESRWKL